MAHIRIYTLLHSDSGVTPLAGPRDHNQVQVMEFERSPLSLPGLSLSDSPEIYLPRNARRDMMNKEDPGRLAVAHSVFYLKDCSDSRAKASKRAAADIAAIRMAFPDVRNSETVLAMAAWFALLCNVDDEVERMDSDASQLALIDSISILEASPRNGRRSLVGHGGACLDPAYDRIRALTKTFVRQVRRLVARSVYADIANSIGDVWDAMRLERQYKTEAG